MYIFKPSRGIDINRINRYFKQNKVYAKESPVDGIKKFDTKQVLFQIKEELKAVDGTSKCEAFSLFDDAPYIKVVTSYKLANEVLPKIHMISAMNGLALYDAESEKSFFKELVCESLINQKTRKKELLSIIRKKLEAFWRIHKLENNSCTVTVRKVKNKKFNDITIDFYDLLEENLLDEERLICEDGMYIVKGESYEINFVLEGYYKSACELGVGKGDSKLMRRMSTYQAFLWMHNNYEKKEEVYNRMMLHDMNRIFPNPADRLVASVNISKWENRTKLDVAYTKRYSGHMVEMNLRVVHSEYWGYDIDSMSKLELGFAERDVLLPIIKKYNPYIYKRFYECNHLPCEIWYDILEELKEKKDSIFANPNSESYIFRHKWAELCEVLYRWSDAQCDTYGDDIHFDIVVYD